jgi:hypothetical protein
MLGLNNQPWCNTFNFAPCHFSSCEYYKMIFQVIINQIVMLESPNSSNMDGSIYGPLSWIYPSFIIVCDVYIKRKWMGGNEIEAIGITLEHDFTLESSIWHYVQVPNYKICFHTFVHIIIMFI